MKTIGICATVARHIEAFHLDWVRYLRKSNYKLVGFAADISRNLNCESAFDVVYDVPFSRNPLSIRQFLNTGRVLKSIVDRENIRLIHFHTPNAAFWGRIGLRSEWRRRKCKILYTAHGFHFGHNCDNRVSGLAKTAEMLCARWTDALITINSTDYAIANHFRLPSVGKVYQIPGVGVDLDRFNPNKSLVDPLPEICREAAIILMVAEFSPGKRHRDAVAAFNLIDRSDVHLVFAGDGLIKGEIQKLASESRFSHRIHFLGYRNDMPELLKRASVLLLPSEREGLPASIMEAMAMGVPVVGSKTRGISDLLDHNSGLLHEIGDPNDIAIKIKSVLEDPLLKNKITGIAKEKITQKYSSTAVRSALVDIYKACGFD